jgi:hypothetical protein
MGIPTNKPITQLELSARPEAQLRYPGSLVVKSGGSNEIATRDPEPDPAYAGGRRGMWSRAHDLNGCAHHLRNEL